MSGKGTSSIKPNDFTNLLIEPLPYFPTRRTEEPGLRCTWTQSHHPQRQHLRRGKGVRCRASREDGCRGSRWLRQQKRQPGYVHHVSSSIYLTVFTQLFLKEYTAKRAASEDYGNDEGDDQGLSLKGVKDKMSSMSGRFILLYTKVSKNLTIKRRQCLRGEKGTRWSSPICSGLG